MVIGVVPLDLGGEQQGRAEGGLRVILVCGQSEMSRRTEVCLKLWCEVGLVSSIGSFEQFNWNLSQVNKLTPCYDWLTSSLRMKKIFIPSGSCHPASQCVHSVSVCVCVFSFLFMYFLFYFIIFFAFTFTVPSLSWRGTIAKSWKIN